MPSVYSIKLALQRLLLSAIAAFKSSEEDGIAYQIHRLLVLMGLFFAVLPAARQLLLLAVLIIIPFPPWWITYFVGWWALVSLVRVFLYLLKGSPAPSANTWLGIIIGSITSLLFHGWLISKSLISQSLQNPRCISCEPPFGYSPSLLCILVGMHWAYLCWRRFRLTARPNVTPGEPEGP